MATTSLPMKKQGIASFLSTDAVRQNVLSVVGEKDMQRFVSSVVSAVQTTQALQKCKNSTILSAALLGHSLNLPQSPQLGCFYLVPYGDEATFQLGAKGYIQLAIRSGQYKKLNCVALKEGELKSYDPLEETIEVEMVKDYNKRNKLKTIGYYAFFELVNGYKKAIYWSVEEMEAHAKRYSKTYRKDPKSSVWGMNFDAMAQKTMLRQLISKWGIMSIDMQRAFSADMGVVGDNGEVTYVDNPANSDFDYERTENENSEELVVDAEVVEDV